MKCVDARRAARLLLSEAKVMVEGDLVIPCGGAVEVDEDEDVVRVMVCLTVERSVLEQWGCDE